MEDLPFPNLPFQKREKKPRNKGINYVRAPVMVGQCINDYLSAYSSLVDVFKLSGKQAALMSRSSLVDFISTCKKHEVLVAVGNPFMDVALGGGAKVVDSYFDSVTKYEIDIIAIDGAELVIIEVKTRRNALISIEKTISYSQQKRIILAADAFIKLNNIDLDVRFDLILVERFLKSYKFTHCKEIFYPTND